MATAYSSVAFGAGAGDRTLEFPRNRAGPLPPPGLHSAPVAPPAPPRRPSVTPPFSGRDFNGATLLAELNQLREAQVRQPQLNDCALALRQLRRLKAPDAANKIRHLAGGRFASQPALGALLVRWASRLRADADVEALVGHMERLVLSSALIGAMRRGAERLLAGEELE